MTFAAMLLVTSGCSESDTGRVSGTLRHTDGSPLAGARVIARSAESGRSAYGTTDSSGQYVLDGANDDGIPAGNYDVIVLENRGDPDSRRPLTVDAKYRDPAMSGLKVSVTPGESTELNLTLEAP